MDINQIRKDFPLLNKNIKMQGKPLVYFDNAATSLKPQCVLDAMNDYYTNYGVNVHRGDYDLAASADKAYEEARITIAKFINATDKEIVFTKGTTESISLVALGFVKNILNEGDEIILNEAEHASNILPFFEIAKEKNAKVVMASLNKDGVVTPKAIEDKINEHTKFISIAYVSNVLGSENDVKEIIKIAHKHNILVLVDGAQAIPHLPVDVKDLDADFLAFSSHKMCGPTGIGALYGKYELLDKINPINLGGSMNIKFSNDGSYLLRNVPYRLEAGTPAIAEAIGFAAAAKYLTSIGMENIHKYELELKKYAIDKLSKLDNIDIYNPNTQSAIIDFNIKNVFCQDEGSYLNYKGIAVRSGHHCAKLLVNHLNVVGTVRASLYFYNTFEEIDRFVEACKTGGDFLDAFFK